MAIPNEKVLVSPRSLFNQLGTFQGFSREIDQYMPAIIDSKHTSFMPRAEAETDPNFKQIIPYVIVTDGKRILRYVRGKKAGEQRLVSKIAIGVGGHINDHDYSVSEGTEAFYKAAHREVNEELKITGDFALRAVGLINDDSTEVGSVHIGVVLVLHCRPEQVQKNEKAITQLEFLTVAELEKQREQMETWSQICLDHITKILP